MSTLATSVYPQQTKHLFGDLVYGTYDGEVLKGPDGTVVVYEMVHETTELWYLRNTDTKVVIQVSRTDPVRGIKRF